MIKLEVLSYQIKGNDIIYKVKPTCLCEGIKTDCNFRYVLDFEKCCVDGCQNVFVEFVDCDGKAKDKFPLIYKGCNLKEYQLGYYVNKFIKCGACHTYLEVKHNACLKQDTVVQNNLLLPYPTCCECVPCVEDEAIL